MPTLRMVKPDASRNTSEGVVLASVGFAHPGNPPPAKNTGRWTESEHDLFRQGLQLHGKDWTKISSFMNGSRTRNQVYSHAITYFKNNPEAEVEATEMGGSDVLQDGSTHEIITQKDGMLQLAAALGQSSCRNQNRESLPAVETTAATMVEVGQERRLHLDENIGERYFDRSLVMDRISNGLCPFHGNQLIQNEGTADRQAVTNAFAVDGVCLSCLNRQRTHWSRVPQSVRESTPKAAAEEGPSVGFQPSQQEQSRAAYREAGLPSSGSEQTDLAGDHSSPLNDNPNSYRPDACDPTLAADVGVLTQMAPVAENLSMAIAAVINMRQCGGNARLMNQAMADPATNHSDDLDDNALSTANDADAATTSRKVTRDAERREGIDAHALDSDDTKKMHAVKDPNLPSIATEAADTAGTASMRDDTNCTHVAAPRKTTHADEHSSTATSVKAPGSTPKAAVEETAVEGDVDTTSASKPSAAVTDAATNASSGNPSKRVKVTSELVKGGNPTCNTPVLVPSPPHLESVSKSLNQSPDGTTNKSSICVPDNVESSNPYLGKVVVIIEGAHKGRQGRLCHFGNDGKLKIENPNAWVREVVDVERDHCRLVDIVNSDALDEYRKKAGEKFKIIRSVDDDVETSSVAARAVAEDPSRTTSASAFVPGRSEGELVGDGLDVDVNDLGEDEQLQRALELSRKSWEKERISGVSIGPCRTSNLTDDDTKVCQPSLEEHKSDRAECNIPKVANLSPKTHIADKVCTPFSSLPLPSGDGIGERFVQERGNPHHSHSRGRGRTCLDPAETRPPRKRSFLTNKIGPSGGEEDPKIEDYGFGISDPETTKRVKRSLQSSIHFTILDHALKKQTKTFSFTDTKGGQETKQPATGRRLRSSKRIREEEASTIRSTSSKANIPASPDEVRKDQQLQEAMKQPATGRRLRSSKRIREEEASTIRSTSSKANIPASPAVDDKDAGDEALPTDDDNNTQRSSQEQPSKNTLNKESRLKSYRPDFDNNSDRGIARDSDSDSDSDNGEESSSLDVSKDELEELGFSIDEILGMETKICDVIESLSLQKEKSKTLSTQLKLVRFLRNASKEKGPALLISRYRGVDSIFAAIRAFPTSLELLIVAFEGLWNMCFYDKGTWRPDLEIYPDLLDFMKKYSNAKAPSHAKLHFYAISTLQNLGIKRSLKHRMISDGCVEQVVKSMQLYKGDVGIQDCSCLFFQDLMREPQSFEDVKTVLNSGAEKCILAALIRFKNNDKLVDSALAALSNIYFDERIPNKGKKTLLVDHGLLKILCNTIQSDDSCIVFHTINLLNNITSESAGVDKAIVAAGLVTKATEAMHRFRNNIKVLRCACLFMGNISHGEGAEVAKLGGTAAVIYCLQSFPDDAILVREGLVALRNADYPKGHRVIEEAASVCLVVMDILKWDPVVQSHAVSFLVEHLETRHVSLVLGGSEGQKILKGAMTRFPDNLHELANKIQTFLAKRRRATMKKKMEKKNEKEIDANYSKKKTKKKKKMPVSSNKT